MGFSSMGQLMRFWYLLHTPKSLRLKGDHSFEHQKEVLQLMDKKIITFYAPQNLVYLDQCRPLVKSA